MAERGPESFSLGFDQLIAPFSRDRFMADYWEKQFLHIAGPQGRFTPLLPWAELNHILQWHCPPQPPLRMFQDGVLVDARRYIAGPMGSLRLNAGGLIAQLSQGASMILDMVQDVAPRVHHLFEELQQTFDAVAVANLYAGWRTQKAFDVHWDSQEVFVLQLSGRKRWQVFAPTREFPLDDDIEKAVPPTVAPVWEGIMNDGDLLYLPRGWWHVAFPLDEPSLHVSFGVMPLDGMDFLKWWVQKLRAHPDMRRSAVLKDPKDRKDFLARAIGHLQDSAAGDPLDHFLRERRAERLVRPRVRLPLAPVEQHTPLGSMTTRLRLTEVSGLFIEHPPGEEMAKFYAAGLWWYIRPEFIAAFQLLSGRDSVSFQQMAALIPDPKLVGMLVSALDTLATAGVIFKEAPELP